VKHLDWDQIDKRMVANSLAAVKRIAATYKRRHGSLKGFTGYLMHNHIPGYSLHVEINEGEGTISASGLVDWPENWRDMEKFKGAPFNIPEKTIEEIWDLLDEQQRRWRAKDDPGHYLAAGIDIGPYLSDEDIQRLT
jgi:hypothetical protein